MVVKKSCIALPIFDFNLNLPLFYFAEPSAVPLRYPVCELIGSYIRQRGTTHSHNVAEGGPSGRSFKSETAENVIRAITDGNTICFFS